MDILAVTADDPVAIAFVCLPVVFFAVLALIGLLMRRNGRR